MSIRSQLEQSLPSPHQIELSHICELNYQELEKLLEEKENTGSRFPMYKLKKTVEAPPIADVWSHNGRIGEASENFIQYPENKGTGEKNPQAFGIFAGNLKMRADILKKIAVFIIREQDIFFKGGALKSITQRECAQDIGIHESLISRALQNKTIEVDGRVEPLSRFFTIDAVHPETIGGWLASKKEQKNADGSNRSLSDRELTEEWNKDFPTQPLARRTMAKYRRAADIAPSEYKGLSPEITKRKVWLKEQIENEDADDPLTDDSLAQKWNIDNPRQRINSQIIARYRNEMHIFSSYRRKKKC